MEHHFNHKAESFDSPKNIFIADLIRQEVEKNSSIFLTSAFWILAVVQAW